MCLDVIASQTADTTGMLQWPCSGTPNQQFWLDYQLPGITASTYGNITDLRPPPPPSQPMVPAGYSSLDKSGASSWAKSYGLTSSIPNPYNRITNIFGQGEDCTNFVSAAWHLGGKVPMNDRWYMRYGFGAVGQDFSTPWLRVIDFVSYWQSLGKVTVSELTPSSDFTPTDVGDAIAWMYDGASNFTHLTIVTGWTLSTISYYDSYAGKWYSYQGDQISQHGADRVNSPWNLKYRMKTVSGGSHNDRAFWIHWN
jgi:Putative amidase domain